MFFFDFFEFRDFKRFNSDLFKMVLDVVDWLLVFSFFDVNESLFCFFYIFNSVSNKYVFLKLFKVRNLVFKLWIIIGLKKLIKVWDKFYKKWLIIWNLLFLNKYKFYCNKIIFINKLYCILYYI